MRNGPISNTHANEKFGVISKPLQTSRRAHCTIRACERVPICPRGPAAKAVAILASEKQGRLISCELSKKGRLACFRLFTFALSSLSYGRAVAEIDVRFECSFSSSSSLSVRREDGGGGGTGERDSLVQYAAYPPAVSVTSGWQDTIRFRLLWWGGF